MILIAAQAYPPATGGIQTVMLGLARALARHGEEVTVLADGTKSDGIAAADASERFAVRRFSGLKFFRRIIKGSALSRAASLDGVKAVFCDSWKSLERVPDLDVPVIVLAHGTEYPPDAGARKIIRIKRSLQKATFIAPVSGWTAKHIRPFLPDGAKVRIINPAILDQPRPSQEALRTIDAIINDRQPVLASLSRLEERKGIDMYIGAIARLKEKFPDILGIVAGDGPDRPRLQGLAQEFGVTDHVYFAGRVSDSERAAILSRADLYVMPGRVTGASVEGYGLAYLEAGAYGTPSVASLSGGVGDAVLNGETGFLVDTSSLDDITGAVETFLSDDDLRYRLGENAMKLAREDRAWHNVVRKYLELI